MYNKNFFSFVFLGLFIILSIVSINRGIREQTPRWYDRAVLFVIAPFQRAFRYMGESILYKYYRYSFLLNAEDNIRKVNKTNMLLQHELSNLYELKYENTRLRRMLNFKKQKSFAMVPAQIVAVDVTPNFKSIRINRGSDNNVKLGEPVVNYEGIVGKILKVYPKYSDVILLLDNHFVVDAFVQRSRARGVIYGADSRLVDMKYVHRFEDVKKGDFVVSSGYDGVFPKGLLVGIVDSVILTNDISQKIKVKPVVSFKKLEEVFVISNK